MNKNKKLWGGRFAETTAHDAELFSASIQYDQRLYEQDIAGSIAHAKMLQKIGILNVEECERITAGLMQIREEIESGSFEFRTDREDIHMNIEARLTELIGAPGEKLHTARSRNDQVATDVRLYLRKQTDEIIKMIFALQRAFVKKACEYKNAVMPGFTHLQHAQPVLVAHHLLAYVNMLERDKQRYAECRTRIDVMPLGSCAFAGTPIPIDREYTANILGFSSVSQNSIDAVSDRDFIAEFLSVSAILGMHLSRLGEELVLWTSPEFAFVSLPDAYCTGSSIMPQKKNPDMAELVRGKTGRLYGNLISLLTLMKGLPLTYNRDLQEDKEPLFDTVDTVRGILSVCTGMLDRIVFNTSRLYSMADTAFILATEIADYLVMKGIPFRSCHEITGKIVAYCEKNKKTFQDLSLDEWKTFSPHFDSGIEDIVILEKSIQRKKSAGSTAPSEIERQLTYWESVMEVE
ncbi:MAG: argininosuccinate lyase [Candidatus Auribacter fodinae]|uniref:Argininosuccinate lyase n=1 Tax=Candidatus Auribacter fodinae TaxID=2093366 RepID=A0A3A4RDS6_9BACT|nr:MAG: argininosuccinate lyase [Candidatus Auribacter fodinae]